MLSSHDHSADQMQQLMQEFTSLFESIAHKTKQRMHQVTTEFQLANGQIFVMMMLNKQGICKATDIANLLGVTSGAVTGLTDKLVNMGILHRVRSEEDRRVVQFTLTDKGRKMVKQIHEERMKMFLQTFSKLKLEDIEKMLDVFKKLNSILE